jgi:hypothetical protein
VKKKYIFRYINDKQKSTHATFYAMQNKCDIIGIIAQAILFHNGEPVSGSAAI